jgi:hypothetical protein
MGVHNILQVACKALADHITTNIPALDMVHVGAADAEDRDSTPCATLIPGRAQFVPSLGVDELDSGVPGVALADIGCFEGTVELSVSSKFAAQREEMEQRLINLFMRRNRRGVLVVQTPQLLVNDRLTLYRAPVAFSLLSSGWDDEMVWDKKRYTFVTLEVAFPCLVGEDAYTIEEYHAALSEDLTSLVPEYEAASVDEDGNVTPQ